MKKLLLVATLAASTLLTGCGKAAVNAPVIKPQAAVAAAASKLTGKLVITTATSAIKEREDGSRSRQEWEVVGQLNGKPFSFSTSTFFPYYVPMLAGSKLNGKDDALKAETAAALLKLFKAAEATDEQKLALHNLNYGLEFRSHRDLGQN